MVQATVRISYGICNCGTLHWSQRRGLRGRLPGGLHPSEEGRSDKFATEDMIYIDPVECIDCGACVPVCPVSAIFALDDLPEKWSDFAQKNATYFGR